MIMPRSHGTIGRSKQPRPARLRSQVSFSRPEARRRPPRIPDSLVGLAACQLCALGAGPMGPHARRLSLLPLLVSEIKEVFRLPSGVMREVPSQPGSPPEPALRRIGRLLLSARHR